MDCVLAYFKPIFNFLTLECKRVFSEVSATFANNALKMDTYIHIWPMFHFFPIKTPKTLQFSDLKLGLVVDVDVQGILKLTIICRAGSRDHDQRDMQVDIFWQSKL